MQVRAINIFSYVTGAAPKILEMAEWLEPGGELMLGGWIRLPQGKEVTLQRFGATIRALIAEGWRVRYQRNFEGAHDVLTLQKPTASAARESDVASTTALNEFVQDSASWATQADRLIAAMAKRQGIQLHYDSLVGLLVTDDVEEGDWLTKLFRHTIERLFGGAVRFSLLAQAVDPESSQAAAHVEAIEAVVRTNPHLVGVFFSPRWVGRFFASAGDLATGESVRFVVKTAPNELEGVSVNDEAVFLQTLASDQSLTESARFLWRMAEYMRHWLEQMLPEKLDTDFLEAAVQVMSETLGPDWTPSPLEKTIRPVSA